MSEVTDRVRLDNSLLPGRMMHLPRDKRGYIVPWFVQWLNSEPVFPAFDPDKWRLAVKQGRCWVCGGHMGRWMTFVVGPMCTINRVSAEPPSHIECAEYSAKVCPFLANPNMRRVPHEKVPGGEMIQPGGLMEDRNPGLMALWRTRKMAILPTATGPLVQMGDPSQIDWWYRGRMATPYEIHEGFETGAAVLRRRAVEIDGEDALPEINRLTARARKLLPPLPPGAPV